MRFLRALFAFIALPGMVAGVLPWIIVPADPWRGDGWWPGAAALAAGVVILLWCVRDFYVAGKGTLAPWDPPKSMVRRGLYAFTRNPMYIGVLTIVSGWSVLAGSPLLAIYAVALGLLFHLRVVFYEEPWLQRQFPAEWSAYAAHVPRWVPRGSPWPGTTTTC